MTLSARIEALLPIVALIADSTVDEVRATVVDMIRDCDLNEPQIEAILKAMLSPCDAPN